MCGLGTNAVTISSKTMVKERNSLYIHDTSILAFTFKVTHWITWCILTVISFYDHACDHACHFEDIYVWHTFSRSHIR